jgi:hypothetical protein
MVEFVHTVKDNYEQRLLNFHSVNNLAEVPAFTKSDDIGGGDLQGLKTELSKMITANISRI